MSDHDEHSHSPSPKICFGIRTIRTQQEPYPGSVPIVGDPPFVVSLTLACSICQEQTQIIITGHHVRTIHRALGQIIEKYPQYCEEGIPTVGRPQRFEDEDGEKEQVN